MEFVQSQEIEFWIWFPRNDGIKWIFFSFFFHAFLFHSVPIFKGFPEDTLIKISDVLEETHYQQGDYIVSF